MTDYQHKSIIKLSELYEKHKKEMGSGMSFMAMMWKALSPQIPDILKGLDDNPEMLAKIKVFLGEIAKTMEEDMGKTVEFEDRINEAEVEADIATAQGEAELEARAKAEDELEGEGSDGSRISVK